MAQPRRADVVTLGRIVRLVGKCLGQAGGVSPHDILVVVPVGDLAFHVDENFGASLSNSVAAL